jgi:serine/threonine protein kinase
MPPTAPSSDDTSRLIKAVRAAINLTPNEQQEHLDREFGPASQLRAMAEAALTKGRADAAPPPESAVRLPASHHIMPEPNPPVSLEDLFELLDVIGGGATSTVYKARDKQAQQIVAVKLLHSHRVGGKGFAQAMRVQHAQTRRLSNPNIIRVFAGGRAAEGDYVVMEHIQGTTLANWTADRGGPIPLREAAVIVRTLARAIQDAHQAGFKHFDLKASNILVAGAPDLMLRGIEDRLKVIDFGLPQNGETAPRTAARSLPFTGGTLGFMAPEQLGQFADQKADVFALGMLLAYLSAGGKLYDATHIETLRSLDDELKRDQSAAQLDAIRQQYRKLLDEARSYQAIADPALAAVCKRCLALDPEKRYATAEALAADLEKWLADRPVAKETYQYSWWTLYKLLVRRCRATPDVTDHSTLCGLAFWVIGPLCIVTSSLSTAFVLAGADHVTTAWTCNNVFMCGMCGILGYAAWVTRFSAITVQLVAYQVVFVIAFFILRLVLIPDHVSAHAPQMLMLGLVASYIGLSNRFWRVWIVPGIVVMFLSIPFSYAVRYAWFQPFSEPVLGWTVGLVMLAFAARFTWPPFTQTPPAPVRPE